MLPIKYCCCIKLMPLCRINHFHILRNIKRFYFLRYTTNIVATLGFLPALHINNGGSTITLRLNRGFCFTHNGMYAIKTFKEKLLLPIAPYYSLNFFPSVFLGSDVLLRFRFRFICFSAEEFGGAIPYLNLSALNPDFISFNKCGGCLKP